MGQLFWECPFSFYCFLTLLANQRRIFGGTNLFAQGACFSAREKVEERRLKGYLFLGNDLVRYNIGMEMTINGSPAYYALIAAGVNWYEAEKECELILDGTEELEFVVSSMESGKRNRYTMKLDGLPKRPPKTTRRNLYEVLDLKFGACKMCVCGPKEAKKYLNSNEIIRVASKYPHIAKEYFNNQKLQTVEIVKLNGSVELAPIVGLSEVIVDIVSS